jgi:two-component sensor histidine kinase
MEKLAELLHVLGQSDSAYKILKKTNVLYEKEEEMRQLQQVTRLSLKFESEQNEQIILEQKKKNKKIAQVLYGAMMLLILWAVTLIVLFNFYKKVKSQNTIITHTSSQLAQTNIQKDILLKEVHHRVKNNLQVISGLLQIHGAKLKDESALAVFQESRQSIRAMSLVHEMLYSEENFGLIDMSKYLAKFCKTISQQYNARATIKTELAQIKLPLNKAMILGFITSELITNSYKHAFQGEKGEVKISLSEVSKNSVEYTYNDNGKGISQIDSEGVHAGLRLIQMLCEQLNA